MSHHDSAPRGPTGLSISRTTRIPSFRTGTETEAPRGSLEPEDVLALQRGSDPVVRTPDRSYLGVASKGTLRLTASDSVQEPLRIQRLESGSVLGTV